MSKKLSKKGAKALKGTIAQAAAKASVRTIDGFEPTDVATFTGKSPRSGDNQDWCSMVDSLTIQQILEIKASDEERGRLVGWRGKGDFNYFIKHGNIAVGPAEAK